VSHSKLTKQANLLSHIVAQFVDKQSVCSFGLPCIWA